MRLEEYGPDARNKLELRLMEQRKDEYRPAQSMIKVQEGQVIKMVRDMAELRLEEAKMEMSW